MSHLSMIRRMNTNALKGVLWSLRYSIAINMLKPAQQRTFNEIIKLLGDLVADLESDAASEERWNKPLP